MDGLEKASDSAILHLPGSAVSCLILLPFTTVDDYHDIFLWRDKLAATISLGGG